MQRLEPAVDRAQPSHLPSPYGGWEALDLDGTEIATLEKLADEPSRRVVAQHAARLSHRLEPGRQVGGFTYNPSLLRAALADQISHNHDTGCDTDAGRQSCSLPFKTADPLHEGETGPECPFGILFVRVRIAEIYKRTIPHILGDEAAKFGDFISHGGLVAADHLAQILRIELRRKRR